MHRYNAAMHSPAEPSVKHIWGLDPVLFGVALSFVSAALYAVTNVCLRSSIGHNDIWVSCLKTAPTAFVAIGLLILEHHHRPVRMPAPHVLLVLIATALISQWGGNVAFQVGLRTIGLAVGPPITFGMLMISGAILGRIWLGEKITIPMAIGILALIVSIALLKVGAKPGEITNQTMITWGAAAVCLAGFAYALLGAVIRWATLRGVSPNMSVMIVGLVGLLTLGGTSVAQLGIDGLLATPRNEFLVMLTAGLCNTLAFLLLASAFEFAPVSQVNAVNSSQVAMSSLAGVLIFQEPLSTYLGLGVALMIAGLWLINRRQPA